MVVCELLPCGAPASWQVHAQVAVVDANVFLEAVNGGAGSGGGGVSLRGVVEGSVVFAAAAAERAPGALARPEVRRCKLVRPY